MPIPNGPTPTCRSGLPARVFPDQDTLICDPTPTLASNHLAVTVRAQNYGENSYRIRQPFDFAGRTGTIVFDVAGAIPGLDSTGWTAVEITEDPISVPSYAEAQNVEGGAEPRNGIEIQLSNPCAGGPLTVMGVKTSFVFNDYERTELDPSYDCVDVKTDSVNRFKIQLSTTRVQVFATPYSKDGNDFGAEKMIYDRAIDLAFTRGYVHLTTHNHASVKYSENNALEAVVSRWDNVGFDGPIIDNWREYDVPDSLTPASSPNSQSSDEVNIGYRIGETETAVLHFTGVDLSGMNRARVSMTAWYMNVDEAVQGYSVHYRFNGKTWHDRAVTAKEAATIINGRNLGTLEHMIDVDFSELVSGDNKLEVTSLMPNKPTGPYDYSPCIQNISLILEAQ